MNKRGQTLIIFIMLIPIMILLTALIVDVGYMTYQASKYRGIIDTSIKTYFDKNSLTSAKEVLELNEIKDGYEIKTEDSAIHITFDTQISSIFGKIININEYKIHIDRKGQIKNKKVIIEKGTGD